MKAEGEAEFLGKQVAELQSQVNGLKLKIDVRQTSTTFPPSPSSHAVDLNYSKQDHNHKFEAFVLAHRYFVNDCRCGIDCQEHALRDDLFATGNASSVE